ncbi:MAG: methionyl-tRNA formyltransferase [Synergistaceae bacterium]|nr:methionyl-tRNA formyltransferase [Synergistaceae bacterium]
MKRMNDFDFWFVGTGEFAALLLPMLAKRYNFSRIITRAPSKAKRGLKDEITPVERIAVEIGLRPLRTTVFTSDELIISEFTKSAPDGIFVIDFGEKILEPFLTGTELGCVNIHPSLLPKYRGAAPIQRALENGEQRIGATLFQLAEEMDAGPIISQISAEISLEENYPEIMNKAAALGSQLANEWLSKITSGANKVLTYPQAREAATFAPKISKSESEQSFDISATLLHNRVRAFYPSPGVWVPFRGKRLKLISTYPLKETITSSKTGEITVHEGIPTVKCKEGSIILKQVQPEGKRIMNGEDWLNGSRVSMGDVIE